ncbi:unnamed protein product [Mytilus coruscus]|uniref:Uncharacterized protein n=1 Tax=Mytilus coruscus TaxID=42192 RepID=A0A6J8BRI7_MYTCO|nr:unnamed protein product [Mytilus coruscus]
MSNRKRSLRKRDKKKRLIKYKSKLCIHNNNKGHLKRTKNFHENVKKALHYIEVFSQENLTNYEILVLAKGLKCIPSPDVKYIKQKLLLDFDELGRKMRCKYHFSDKSNTDSNHPFRVKSGFKPALANNTIENYLFATKMEICRLKINKVRYNLSKHERAALKTLRSNNNIIIKKADKNSSTVVLDKSLYIKQTLNFLNNSSSYPCYSIGGYCTSRRCRIEYYSNPEDDITSHPDCSYTQLCCQPYNGGYYVETAQNGHAWNTQRTFMNTALRSLGFGKKNMESKVLGETQHFRRVLSDLNEEPILSDIRSSLKYYLFHCIREKILLQ